MPVKALLEFQLTGSFNLIKNAVSGMTDDEWVARPHPTANLLGFTLWHCLRTIDWTVNGIAARRSELADQPEWSDVKPSGSMFGAGLTREEADGVARGIGRSRLLEYEGELRSQVFSWFRPLREEDFDRPVDLKGEGLATRDHLQPAAWREIEDLDGLPLWQFLARPAVSHTRVHYGEVMAQLEAVRAQAGEAAKG